MTKKLKFIVLLLICSLLNVNLAWGTEITLLATDFATNNGYFTTEQTITKTVSFGYIQAYKSNANNTPTGWAKEQALVLKGNSGQVYNKAAISTISNIRVYVVVNTNSFTLSYGTTTACIDGSITRPTTASGTESITYTSYNSDTKKSTSGQTTTATYYDFDLSSASPTYFKIANGSNQLFIWKIVITYSSCTKLGQINGSINRTMQAHK